MYPTILNKLGLAIRAEELNQFTSELNMFIFKQPRQPLQALYS